MVSFCFFFFVDNFPGAVDKSRSPRQAPGVESGLAPGYGFPGCIPDHPPLRPRPLDRDWKHPGPMFAGPIPDSLMGRLASAFRSPCLAASMRTVGVL